MILPLEDRGLLGLKGNDASEFLQGVITQDIRRLEQEKLLYTAHLTPQGRILFDFFILKIDDMIVLDCHKNNLMPLAQKLHAYVIGKDVEFLDMSDDYNVFALLKESSTKTNATQHLRQCFNDPRHTNMGKRLYLTKEEAQKIEPTGTATDYLSRRIELGVVDLAFDGLLSKNIASEVNLDHLNAINYNKGCYVGQEMTARTHFRTSVKKRIFVIEFNKELTVKDRTIYKDKMEAGTLFSHRDGKGLALIRNRYLESPLYLEGEEIKVRLPEWFKQESA